IIGDRITARPYEFACTPSKANIAPPKAEPAIIILRGRIPYLRITPKSAGSLTPNNWVNPDDVAITLADFFLLRIAIAKATAALAKPYIAQTVISGLKPVAARRVVSIVINR